MFEYYLITILKILFAIVNDVFNCFNRFFFGSKAFAFAHMLCCDVMPTTILIAPHDINVAHLITMKHTHGLAAFLLGKERYGLLCLALELVVNVSEGPFAYGLGFFFAFGIFSGSLSAFPSFREKKRPLFRIF